jgi:anti-anti-sigma factor
MPLLLEHHQGQTQAHLQGELTIFDVEAIQDDLLSLLNHKEIILDLSELQVLDGCGAQLLAILQLEARRSGKQIIFTAHNAMVEHTLQQLGITVQPPAGKEH